MKYKTLAYLATLAIIITFTSCHSTAKEDNGIVFNEFPKSSIVNAIDSFLKDSTIDAENVFIADTSLNIAKRGRCLTKNYLFYEYSLDSKNLVGKLLKWVTKNNETYGPMAVGQFRNKTLRLHDITLNKVLTFNLADKYSFDSIKNAKRYNTPQFAYSVQLLDSNTLLESGMFDIPQNYMQILNLATSTPLSQIEKFVAPSNRFPPNTWKGAYEGFLFLKPDEKAAAIACRYADRVTFFDLDSNHYKIITGPQNFEPSFIPIPQNTSTKNYSISRTNITVFTFLDGASTNEYLYLMFSGKKGQENNSNLRNVVYVYNWKGKPIEKLQLDRQVSGICISNDNKDLDAIDPIII